MKFQSLITLVAFVSTTLVASVHAADPPPLYSCETDADCEANFPDTVCIAVDNYGDVIKKCTPNTSERPACRGGQPGLCPSYQSEEIGYLNVHCVFVAKDADGAPTNDAANTSTSNSTKATRFLMFASDAAFAASKAGSGTNDAVVTPPKTTPAPISTAGYAKVKFGSEVVVGQFQCVDISDCENQAYDKTTCEPKECGSPGSKMQCNNHGTCTYPSIQTMDKRRCACYKGYSGDKCQTEISNECDVDCGAGGTCEAGECVCKKGFDGAAYKGKQGKPNQRCTKCTNDLGCQNSNPCDIQTGTCVCNAGYFGPTCGATEDSCTKKDCGIGNCQVLGNGSSACFCPLCAPDCVLCKTKDCSTCPSGATTTTVSKSVVFVSAIMGLMITNLLL